MKKLILISLLLTGCATTLQPKVGMDLATFQSQCMGHNLTKGQLVAAEQNVEVYTCGRSDVLYAFQDAHLVKVFQTDKLPRNGNSANLMGFGLGLINANQPQPASRPVTCVQQGVFTNCY